MSFGHGRPRLRHGAIAALAAVVCACASAPRVEGSGIADPGLRIVDARGSRDISSSQLLAALVRADVVVFGEQHDDREAHRAQAWLLDALGSSGRRVVLSLEMFERDVQPLLDDYVAGRAAEPEFLAHARPWPNYATDYRPLVAMARERGWPVVAANVPRPMASAVGRRGMAALDALPATQRAHAARELLCPEDDYRLRFLEQMRSHSPMGGAGPADTLPTAMAERFYLAQCLKDETMAESVVAARREAPGGAVVLHVTGSFHAEYGQGVVERIRRRDPGADVAVIIAVPTPDPSRASIAAHRARADFLILSRRPPIAR